MLIAVGIWVMMVISIYQYSWSLFADRLAREFPWGLAAISLTFTVFNYTSTLVSPFCGFVADTFGPRRIALMASGLVGAGFLLSSLSSSPGELYLYYGLGGIGVGVLYGISTALAVKWFPDRRGLATGLVVFGFGAGTALFNWLIQMLLEASGFAATFRYLGLLMLVFLVPCAFFIQYPRKSGASAAAVSRRPPPGEFPPMAMLRTHQWFLIYFSFSFTISVVLIFAAQMKMLAQEFKLPRVYFDALLVLFPMGNGFSRVVAGAVSDKFGREKTLSVFYFFLSLSIFALIHFGMDPLLFVLLVTIAALLGGGAFALYPAMVGDYYGAQYATTNYGITYTAKTWAGLISGWASGYLVTQFGSYKIPLMVIAVASLGAALLSSPWLMRSPQAARLRSLGAPPAE